MASITIIDVRKTIAPSGPRLGQIDTLVSYKDEANQFFLLTIDKASPTEQDIVAAIKADVAARGAIVGKTVAF